MTLALMWDETDPTSKEPVAEFAAVSDSMITRPGGTDHFRSIKTYIVDQELRFFDGRPDLQVDASWPRVLGRLQKSLARFAIKRLSIRVGRQSAAVSGYQIPFCVAGNIHYGVYALAHFSAMVGGWASLSDGYIEKKIEDAVRLAAEAAHSNNKEISILYALRSDGTSVRLLRVDSDAAGVVTREVPRAKDGTLIEAIGLEQAPNSSKPVVDVVRLEAQELRIKHDLSVQRALSVAAIRYMHRAVNSHVFQRAGVGGGLQAMSGRSRLAEHTALDFGTHMHFRGNVIPAADYDGHPFKIHNIRDCLHVIYV